MKYFYAAYVMEGGEKMGREEFAAYFVDQTIKADLLYVVTQDYKDDDRPVGIAILSGEENTYEVHAKWMPWSSSRDKVTAFLTFIMRLRNKYTLLFAMSDSQFLQHMGKYGVLRKVGIIYRGDDGIALWQSRAR